MPPTYLIKEGGNRAAKNESTLKKRTILNLLRCPIKKYGVQGTKVAHDDEGFLFVRESDCWAEGG